jgi:hypothetical protein
MTLPSKLRYEPLEWGRHTRVSEVGRMAKGKKVVEQYEHLDK